MKEMTPKTSICDTDPSENEGKTEKELCQKRKTSAGAFRKDSFQKETQLLNNLKFSFQKRTGVPLAGSRLLVPSQSKKAKKPVQMR